MSIYTFYMHTISGDIATIEDWRSDYESMDSETWHGKPAEECNPDDWIEDGKLEKINLHSDDECHLTNGVFPFCFTDVSDGEEYLSEWGDYAKDDDGNRYIIIWRFPAVKGEEPEDDEWPWYDDTFIHRIKAL